MAVVVSAASIWFCQSVAWVSVPPQGSDTSADAGPRVCRHLIGPGKGSASSTRASSPLSKKWGFISFMPGYSLSRVLSRLALEMRPGKCHPPRPRAPDRGGRHLADQFIEGGVRQNGLDVRQQRLLQAAFGPYRLTEATPPRRPEEAAAAIHHVAELRSSSLSWRRALPGPSVVCFLMRGSACGWPRRGR